MDQLRQPLCSRGREEIAVLQRRQLQDVQSRGQDEAQRVGEGSPPRDKRYYEQPVQQELEIYQLKISEFFPLERTAKGMLDIFASLLGLLSVLSGGKCVMRDSTRLEAGCTALRRWRIGRKLQLC